MSFVIAIIQRINDFCHHLIDFLQFQPCKPAGRANHEMKQQLNNSQLITSLFTYATEGIILANRQGEIVLINPYGEKMFGYTREELTGQRIEVLIPASLRHKHEAHRDYFHKHPVNRSMGTGRDLYAQRKDGSTFPVEVSLSHYESNGETFVIAFVIDITVRKHNEEILRNQKEELERVSQEIKKLNSELEQKVEDRTMMLSETLIQLEKSKNELEASLEKEKELSDLKTRFVSTVSHEFRTPLSTVLSSANLIDKYETTGEQDKRARHVQRIKESVKHLSDMLEDLLSLGKLEEGLIVPKVEMFDSKSFMSDFIAEMNELAKPTQYLNFTQKGTVQICTDKRLLKTVLLNLLSNALKFSSEGGHIDIKLESDDDKIVLSVKDDGIGISVEDQEHLFERFFRARNAANIQGTGLGLHIVSKYVELLAGKVSLKSALGSGTTFIVTIPNHAYHE